MRGRGEGPEGARGARAVGAPPAPPPLPGLRAPWAPSALGDPDPAPRWRLRPGDQRCRPGSGCHPPCVSGDHCARLPSGEVSGAGGSWTLGATTSCRPGIGSEDAELGDSSSFS